MRKSLKITSITLGSLLAVLIIAICIVVWFVFTPQKLTPVVKEQAKKFVTCPIEIEKVELTFFSTFPHFGLKISGLHLENPMQGAQSDTLLNINQAIATIDVAAWLKNDDIILNEFYLKSVAINAYTDSTGHANYDVMVPSDTTIQDTTAFSLTNLFHSARLDKVSMEQVNITYIDEQQKINAKIINLQSSLTGYLANNDIEGTLKMTIPDLSVSYAGEPYLTNSALKLNIPLQVQVSPQLLTLHQAALSLNDHQIILDGTVANNITNGDINTDLNFSLEKWQIKKVLAMTPPQYLDLLKGIDVDGLITLTGSVKGIYNKEKMPLCKASLEMEDGTLCYADLPFKFHDIFGKIEMQSDLNTDSISAVHIHNLRAKTPQSEFGVTGSVNNLLSDMLCDLNIDAKVNLSEMQPLVPKEMKVSMKGKTAGKVHAKFLMSQLDAMAIDKMKINGKLNMENVILDYDTLGAKLNNAIIDFSLPNNTALKNAKDNFLQLAVLCNNLQLKQGKTTSADAMGSQIKVTTSNILNPKGKSVINCHFTLDHLNGVMDNMSVDANRPRGDFGALIDLNDSTAIPTINCNFAMANMSAYMDSMAVHITKPNGKLGMQANAKNPKQPKFTIIYHNESLQANMGEQKVKTEKMDINANVIQNADQKNILLQWIPKGYVSLEKGNISYPNIADGIQIPTIQFDFTPEKYTIKDSKVIIGRSDFQLLGELKNVLSYLRGDSILLGNFNLNSNAIDVLAIMNMTSGIGNDESENEPEAKPIATSSSSTTSSTTSSGPFMVPKGMKLSLKTTIKQAFIPNDTAKNVEGNVFLNDGTLILENMHFVTSAAKMQLTAMYKTPRKNHLFVGLDYHLMDIEIHKLLTMIPDIDSIMPMLRSFGGKGEFHIAVETNLDSLYNLKKSTLLGSASVRGEDLVLMDGETFSEIAKMLRFRKQAQNKVDSLSAEFTIFKEEIDVYPFLIVMDKYKAVIGGRHNIDMTFDYNISLIDSPLPLQLGLDISGNLDKMKFRLAKCKYAKLYRPVARKSVDTSQLKLKKLIRESLVGRVKQ